MGNRFSKKKKIESTKKEELKDEPQKKEDKIEENESNKNKEEKVENKEDKIIKSESIIEENKTETKQQIIVESIQVEKQENKKINSFIFEEKDLILQIISASNKENLTLGKVNWENCLINACKIELNLNLLKEISLEYQREPSLHSPFEHKESGATFFHFLSKNKSLTFEIANQLSPYFAALINTPDQFLKIGLQYLCSNPAINLGLLKLYIDMVSKNLKKNSKIKIKKNNKIK